MNFVTRCSLAVAFVLLGPVACGGRSLPDNPPPRPAASEHPPSDPSDNVVVGPFVAQAGGEGDAGVVYYYIVRN